jgi:site-specific recombinase XerD
VTAGDVIKMMDACGPVTSALATRNRAMIVVLYRYGIKIGAACRMRVNDQLPYEDDGWYDHIVRWSTVRGSLIGGSNSGHMFIAVSGKSMGNPTSTSYWRHLMPRLAYRAGLTQSVSPQDIVASGRLQRIAEVVFDG